jgi:hypothetical protein
MIDLNEAIDQYCSKCKKKKEKYIGMIMGTDSVMYRPQCACSGEYRSVGKSDKQRWEHVSTPFWVHAGLPPNEQDKAKLAYMKAHNMTWGDLRKERDAQYAKSPSGLKAMAEYKKNGAPEIDFRKNS